MTASASEKEFDILRPVVAVLPGQPIPQPFRPAVVCFISGTHSPPSGVDAIEVKPVVKSAHTTPLDTCPNISKLITQASILGDGLITSVPLVVVGLRTVVVSGTSVAPLCPDCKEKECKYAKVIKPGKTSTGGNVRGLSSILRAETTGGRQRSAKAQVLR